MSLSLKNGHVALSILRVKGHSPLHNIFPFTIFVMVFCSVISDHRFLDYILFLHITFYLLFSILCIISPFPLVHIHVGLTCTCSTIQPSLQHEDTISFHIYRPICSSIILASRPVFNFLSLPTLLSFPLHVYTIAWSLSPPPYLVVVSEVLAPGPLSPRNRILHLTTCSCMWPLLACQGAKRRE